MDLPLVDVAYINTHLNVGLTAHLGITYTYFDKEKIQASMPISPHNVQPYGMLHGGASVVLAESIGSLASNLYVDQTKYFCVGLEINANHLRSVSSGYVHATGVIKHKGRTTHVWEIEIRDDLSKLVCLSRLTVAVVQKS